MHMTKASEEVSLGFPVLHLTLHPISKKTYNHGNKALDNIVYKNQYSPSSSPL